MTERYICVSNSAYEVFADVESAKSFAKAWAEKNLEQVVVYLQYGTMCGVVACFGGD